MSDVLFRPRRLVGITSIFCFAISAGVIVLPPQTPPPPRRRYTVSGPKSSSTSEAFLRTES